MDVLVCYKNSRFAKWGAQFKAKDPKNREVILIEPGGPPDKIRKTSLKGIATAAKKAEKGRLIIALGHGGGHATDTSKAMVDLGEKKAFRIQPEVLDYGHDERISDRKLIELARPIINRCRTFAKYKRMPTLKAREHWLRCHHAREGSNRLDLRDKFEEVGKILKSTKIQLVILLSCNVGKGEMFLNKLGRQWGTKVFGYKYRIAVGQDSQGKYRVYFAKDSQEGQGSNTERSRTQVPVLYHGYTSGDHPHQPGQIRIPILK